MRLMINGKVKGTHAFVSSNFYNKLDDERKRYQKKVGYGINLTMLKFTDILANNGGLYGKQKRRRY